MLENLKKDLAKHGSKKKAKLLQGFFKTGKGEYGEGDIFLGVMVPKTREVAKKYKHLSFSDTKKLLKSKIHEHRQCALLILVHNFENGDNKEKRKIVDFYLANTKYVNNWDLVDLTAHKILGAYYFDKNRSILYKLAKSKDLWEKRISVVSTFWFIRYNDFKDSLKLAEIHLNDDHDLMHKAVGWMLREIGKKDQKTEEKFLKKYHKTMPRTMLRYSIERFSENKRKFYMKK
ncbi:DNA alkylation repair protein [Candidatus Woesearchaeota archaeon]|nr:DNA alkylation repair protein [Candidatus Woesearchaeota archaeon]